MESLRESHAAVIRSFFAMASTTLAVAAVALGKEAIVAQHFGASRALDAFVFSLAATYFVPALLAATLQGTFVPAFHNTAAVDRDRAWTFANSVMSGLSCGLVAYALILAVFGRQVIAVLVPGFDQDSQELALSLLWSLLPTVILVGINEQLKNVLNGMLLFAIPSVSQAIPSFVAIIAILFGSARWGIYAFAMGWNVGLLLQTAVLIWHLKRNGCKFAFCLGLDLPEVRRLVAQSIPYLIVPLTSMGLLFVDKYYGSMIGVGVVSYLNYGEKLFRVPWMIVAAALFTTSVPFFAQQAYRSITELQAGLSMTIKLAAFVTIPIAVAMSLLSQPLVAVIFERGAFTSEDTAQTATVLVGFMAALFLYCAGYILDRALCVMRETKILMYWALASFVVKVACAWGMSSLWGLPGLAFSSVPALFLQVIGMYMAINKRVGGVQLGNLIASLAKTAFAAAVMATSMLVIWNHGARLWEYLAVAPSRTLLIGCALVVGASAYWLASLSIGSLEAKSLLRAIGSRRHASQVW